jgi:glucose-6-phosphate isomerase
MLDLQGKTGLPISLNDDGFLEFHPPFKPAKPTHRTLAEMRKYLADPDATFGQASVYDMYRDIHLPQDEMAFKNAGLRFDITVFHPGLIGQEFCKTIGHYHPIKPGTPVSYPETYEVISGKALFLMQKMDESSSQVIDIYAIEAKEGQDVIFLPGYAHFTINAINQKVITSNWAANEFESDYQPVAKYHGAAYNAIKGAAGKPEFIKNTNYQNVPELKFLKPKELPQFGLINNQPAYITGQKSLDMLQFLIKPELYLQELTIENCYIPA